MAVGLASSLPAAARLNACWVSVGGCARSGSVAYACKKHRLGHARGSLGGQFLDHPDKPTQLCFGDPLAGPQPASSTRPAVCATWVGSLAIDGMLFRRS